MELKFRTPLQFSFTKIDAAAVLEEYGIFVEMLRRPGSRRVVFYADDVPEIHKIIDALDRGESLPLSTKSLLETRTDLMQRAKRLAAGEAL